MLRELAAKAKTINIQELALQVAKANEGLILNRQKEQLTVGENADGSDIGKYTTERYSRFKKRIGSQAPTGIPDLKLSGNLYKGLNVKFKPTEFDIDSTVSYSKYQIERYGKNIYGLQKDNAEDIKFKNSVEIVKEYQRQLGL